MLTSLLHRVRRNLPPRTIVIDSQISPAEFEAALRAVTAEGIPWNESAQEGKFFRGSISDREARLVWVTHGYMNSFVPVITGRIEERPEGSRLTATMKLHERREHRTRRLLPRGLARRQRVGRIRLRRDPGLRR